MVWKLRTVEASFSCSWGHESLWNAREAEKLRVEYTWVDIMRRIRFMTTILPGLPVKTLSADAAAGMWGEPAISLLLYR